MAIVTYFLGAGASAGCLPVVNNMAEDISKVSQRLNQESVNQNAQLNDPFYRNEQLASLISPLIQEIKYFKKRMLNTLFY